MVKNSPASAGDTGDMVSILSWEDPLKQKMATHSIILAWKIPWTEEPGGYSPWGHKESDMTEHPRAHTQLRALCDVKGCSLTVALPMGH